MSKIFNFEDFVDHDLYHMRFGKGAVIIAVPAEDFEVEKATWEKIQDELVEEIRKQRKQIKVQIVDLQKELSGLNGGIRRYKQPPSDKEVEIRDKINQLENAARGLAYKRKPYFSNIQLAQFYTHNISRQSEVHTRLDKIAEIEELSTHVKILLEFVDESRGNHIYHEKINISTKTTHGFEVHPIEGIVKRIIPISNVSLEVVSHRR